MGQFLARFAKGCVQQGAVFGPKDDVLQNREVLDQLKVLKHHADARRNRSLAVWNDGLFAANKNLALIGFVETVKD